MWLEIGQGFADGLCIRDVGLNELIARVGGCRFERTKHACIGQLVVNQDLMVRVVDQPTNKS
ncbi:hypothetical protein D3C71_2243370 [compost metagenome]